MQQGLDPGIFVFTGLLLAESSRGRLLGAVELTERQPSHRTGGPRPISNGHVVEGRREVPLSVGKLDGVGHEDARLGLRTATRERAALTTSRRWRRWRLRGSTSTPSTRHLKQ